MKNKKRLKLSNSSRITHRGLVFPALQLILFSILTPISYAIPLDFRPLAAGEFFISGGQLDDVLSIPDNWAFTGTLNAVNRGFSDTHVDEFCVPFFGCSRDKQTVTGQRRMSYQEGVNPAYQLSFEGQFQQETFELWDGSLSGHSQGIHNDPDAERYETSGLDRPIPSSVRSATGYTTQAGQYAEYTKNIVTQKNILSVGEGNCPFTVPGSGLRTGRCETVDTWFAAEADLEAKIQGVGDITDINPLSENVVIDAQTDRKTRLSVNGQSLALIADIQGSDRQFEVNDQKQLGPITFSFDGKLGTDANGNPKPEANIGVKSTWNPANDFATFNSNYNETASMGSFVSAGLFDRYSVSVRDNPDLSAGITGKNFTAAKVLASIGMDELSLIPKVVAKALPGGHLSVEKAVVLNKNDRLRIPAGGFTSAQPLLFNTTFKNDGVIDILVENLSVKVFDEDLVSDDLLLDYSLDFVDFILPPGEIINFPYFGSISPSALNAAADDRFGPFNFEGSYLELIANGWLTYSDTFGRVTQAFDIAFVPEPQGLSLLALLLLALARSFQLQSLTIQADIKAFRVGVRDLKI